MIASRERGIVEQYISNSGSAHSAAYISFPLEDGTYDYLGFMSSDPRAVGFCRDLHRHFWDRAEVLPRSVLVQRHMDYIREHGIDPKYPE